MFRGISKSLLIGLSLAICALLASALFTYRNIQAIAEKEALVVHTHEVLDELRLLFSMTKDAETGQRGFIITGDDDYLKPYASAREGIETSFNRLHSLTADNAPQQERLGALRKEVDRRMEILGEGIEAQQRDGFTAGKAHVVSGSGERQTGIIREVVSEMMTQEQRLLNERSEASKTIYATANTTNVVTTAVGMVLVGAVFAFAVRELVERATREQELEHRVQDRTIALNEANAALRISNRELEQFASVASHDLQEPLRKIEAFGDRLNTRSYEQFDDQGRDYLGRMLQSATRMRTLINDLLTFSRVTTKAQPAEQVSLRTIAEEVASDLEGRLQQSGGRIDLGNLPQIEGDSLQLRQLLQNLIGNGLKFQRPGVSPVVRVEARMSRDGANDAVCELAVQDNGIGFDEVYLDRIFNVFQRLHGRNEYEGTGMGLAICRKIVERHGGTITATSKPDEGARFVVMLPAKQTKKDLQS